jgi:hypothetical protein
MIQINLFCPHCHIALPIWIYTRKLERNQRTRRLGCVMCGRVIIMMDIDQPAYNRKITSKN